MKQKRNSSIELLRIVSMILIVLYHYHARKYDLYVIDAPRPEDPNFLYELLTHSIGKLGVPIFVFISGWYGIKFRKNRIADMIVECMFYAVLSTSLYALLYHGFELKNIIFFINHWWFMAAYICLYILSPGINYIFEKCSKIYSLMVTLVFYFISFGDLVVQSANVGGLFLMLSMYMSARWLRLYAGDFLEKYSLLLLLACIVIRFGTIAMAFHFSKFSILNYVNSYVSPISTLLAAALFVSSLKITFYSKIVNKIAASCLAVYLLSESGFGQVFFEALFPDEYNFVRYLLGSLLIFIAIVVVDQIRVWFITPMISKIHCLNYGEKRV